MSYMQSNKTMVETNLYITHIRQDFNQVKYNVWIKNKMIFTKYKSIEGRGISKKKKIEIFYKLDPEYITIYYDYKLDSGEIICSSERSYKLLFDFTINRIDAEKKTLCNRIYIPSGTGIVSCKLYGMRDGCTRIDTDSVNIDFKIQLEYSTVERGLLFYSKKKSKVLSSIITLHKDK